MNNCVLKLIVLVENILGIYRNYGSFSVMKRVEVSIIMMAHVVLSFYITLTDMSFIHSYHYDEKYKYFYYMFNITFSSVIILLALYNNTKFINLIQSLEVIHAYFGQDRIYAKNILLKSKIIKIAIIVYLITSITLMIYLVYLNLNHTEHKIMELLFMLIYFICEIRYVFEYLVLYGLLAVLSEQVKSITRSIARDTKSGQSGDQINDYEIELLTQDDAYFFKWTQIYSIIKDCSNLTNSVFGVQISIILATAAFYFIILFYSSIANYFIITHGDVVYTTYRATIIMIALYLLSRAAHATEHSVDELRQTLGRLLLHSTTDHNNYKVIQNFLRLITNQPLKTQGFGSVTIDMSLVPKFVMFFTSYTVVALQFNNVM